MSSWTRPPGFACLVDTLSAGRDDSLLASIVLDIHTRIQSHPDPERWLRDQAAAFDLRQVRGCGPHGLGALLLEDARRQVSYWQRRFVEVLDLLWGGPGAGEGVLRQF